MNNIAKPYTDNNNRSRLKMRIMRGILIALCQPKPCPRRADVRPRKRLTARNINREKARRSRRFLPRLNPRLALYPSVGTSGLAPRRRALRPCASPRWAAHASPPHAPRSRNAQRPAPRDNRAGLWQEWFSKPQGKESAIRKVEGRGATTCRTPKNS